MGNYASFKPFWRPVVLLYQSQDTIMRGRVWRKRLKNEVVFFWALKIIFLQFWVASARFICKNTTFHKKNFFLGWFWNFDFFLGLKIFALMRMSSEASCDSPIQAILLQIGSNEAEFSLKNEQNLSLKCEFEYVPQ